MSKTQYLQQLGKSWYLRVKVPAGLQGKVRNTHVRRALHTRDLDEANRRKWPALAHVRAYFDELEQGTATHPSLLLQCVPAHPKLSESKPNPDLGLRPNDGLDALSEQWATTSTVRTVQFQRKQAYKELRAYLGSDSAPVAVTDALAAMYVDERLLKSGDSPSTRRRKLSALAAFWEWMGSRRYVPKGANPWKGYRLSNNDSDRTKPKKRPYTMSELTTLFSGNPTYPALREVMALGLYTGARIDEICSLTQDDIRIEQNLAFVRIPKSKTNAGARTLAVAHPIPLNILKARHRKISPASTQLFHELRGGGYDKKLSWHVGQAFRYYRNGRGLTGATDFHSLRRTFITQLENLGVDQVRIARYVGHSLPTLAFQVYSGGATEATQKSTGKTITYPHQVEKAVLNFILGHPRDALKETCHLEGFRVEGAALEVTAAKESRKTANC